MSKEERLILDYMTLLRHLDLDLRLRLISRLTESIRTDYARYPKGKDDSWKKLFGTWSDTSDDLAAFILRNRRSPQAPA